LINFWLLIYFFNKNILSLEYIYISMNLIKFVKDLFTNKPFVVFIIVAAIVVFVMYIKKMGPFGNEESFEYFEDEPEEDFFEDEEEAYEDDNEIEGYEDVAEQKKVPATKDATLAKGLAPRKQLKPDQLLPKDNEAGAWSKVNPKGKGSLAFKNFIDAGYHLGINTVGQSLRNANLQIRSEPANPQVPVSIWQNSTISPDNNRRDFEVGCKSAQ